MRYPASEKLEILRLVETSPLPVRRTLAQIGIPKSTFYAWYERYLAGGIAALDRVWTAGLRPTAVLAMSDAMAIGAMHALRDLGLSVPGDVSVVGFDDIDLASHVDPPLTTVHQPIRQKGEEAVRLLLGVVGREGRSKPEHRRLDTRLIVRGSSGPARPPR